VQVTIKRKRSKLLIWANMRAQELMEEKADALHAKLTQDKFFILR
jgi:hypothetical protein